MAEQLERGTAPDNTRKPGYVMQSESAFLREHPGESYVLTTFPVEEANKARMMGVGIRQGRYRAFQPGGAYGARTATEDGVVKVYAWYGVLKDQRCADCGYLAGTDGHANACGPDAG